MKIIQDCPDFVNDQYNIYPYLESLIYLQNINKVDAIEVLRLASKQKESQNQVLLLCRMLFVSQGNKCRPPMLGVPHLVGKKTDASKWPSLPIEIVDGIPFLIVKSYSIKGRPELASTYLEYCLSECDWNPIQYKIPLPEEIENALKKIVNSEKWYTKLSADEINWFTSQIIPPNSKKA